MRKLYSFMLVLMISALSAFAGDYSFTVIIQNVDCVQGQASYSDYDLVEGKNVYDPDFSWINLTVNPKTNDDYIVSCVDEDGNPPMRYGSPATTYYGGWVFEPSSCVGKTYTIVADKKANAPKATCYVTVDLPEKIKFTKKSDRYDYLELEAAPARNEIEFIAGLETPLYILPRVNEYNTPIYKVMVDGEEVFPTNTITHEYSITPEDQSEVEITYAFPEENATVTVELPEGLPIDAIESIEALYEDTKTPIEPAASFEVPVGRYVQFNISGDYKLNGYQIGDQDYETAWGSYFTALITEDTNVSIDVRAYEIYELTLTLNDPEHVTVKHVTDDYGYDLEEYDNLGAGDNIIKVPEGRTEVRIYPSAQAIIKSVKDDDDYEYTTGWYDYYKITVNKNLHIIVDSEGFSTDPVQVTFSSENDLDFAKLITKVEQKKESGYYADSEAIEFDETGFTAIPGYYYKLSLDTDGFNVTGATYNDVSTGEKSIFSWGSPNEFQVFGGGEIVFDAVANPEIHFTITIDDPEHLKVYKGYYSTYYDNYEITGFEPGVPKELSFQSTNSYILITLMPEDGYLAHAFNKTEGTNLRNNFYANDGDDIEITVGQPHRDSEAILFIKNRDIPNTTFSFRLPDETYLPDTENFEEGYNVLKFDPAFDIPFYFMPNGQNFWSDETFIYLNDVLLENEQTYGYGVTLDLKANDVIKMFFGMVNDNFDGEAPEFHDVTIEHNGEKNFTVKKDHVVEVSELSAKAHEGTRFDIIPHDGHELEVTVNDNPVELVEGAHTFTIDGPSTIKVTEEQSGISAIAADAADTDVYNLQGIKVLDNATPAQVKALPAGLYIQGGKKIVVK